MELATASERSFKHLEEELLQGLAEIHQRVDSLQSFLLVLDGAVQKLALSGALLQQRLRILEDIVEDRLVEADRTECTNVATNLAELD